MKKRYTQERKREILDYIKDKGITLEEGARNFEIPSGTVYRWSRSKYRAKIYGQEQEGLAQEKKAKEEGKRSGLPEEIQQIIIKYKKEYPGAGLKKIDQQLKEHHFLVIPRKRIREVLKKEGLLEEGSNPEGEAKGERRFEAPYPGDMWQMDVTNVYVKGVPVLYLVVILDDHSRYCLAAELREEMSSDTMIEVMHAVVERHGKSRKLLTDQGRSFYTWSMEQTKFQEYLDGLGVEHIVSEPQSPQSLGLC